MRCTGFLLDAECRKPPASSEKWIPKVKNLCLTSMEEHCPFQCPVWENIDKARMCQWKVRQNSPWASGVVMPETVWVAHSCPTAQLAGCQHVPSREAISGLETCVKINTNLNGIELGGQEGRKDSSSFLVRAWPMKALLSVYCSLSFFYYL